MHAMVIDDSRAMRMILSRTLTDLGFEVSQASHGQDALDQLSSAPVLPDVCLVDWNMPEMSGFEFLQHVRAVSLYDDVPIVMVTTETEVAQMIRALDAGANEYVMKPFTVDTLREKLALLATPS